MISYFLNAASDELNTEKKAIDKKTMRFLENYEWPGNIRQLENACRYLTVMSASSIISIDDLPKDIFDTEESINKNNNVNGNWQTNLEEYIRSNISSDKEVIKKVNAEFEKILIDESLKASNGIKLEAAKLLGCGRNTLARKAKNV